MAQKNIVRPEGAADRADAMLQGMPRTADVIRSRVGPPDERTHIVAVFNMADRTLTVLREHTGEASQKIPGRHGGRKEPRATPAAISAGISATEQALRLMTESTLEEVQERHQEESDDIEELLEEAKEKLEEHEDEQAASKEEQAREKAERLARVSGLESDLVAAGLGGLVGEEAAGQVLDAIDHALHDLGTENEGRGEAILQAAGTLSENIGLYALEPMAQERAELVSFITSLGETARRGERFTDDVRQQCEQALQGFSSRVEGVLEEVRQGATDMLGRIGQDLERRISGLGEQDPARRPMQSLLDRVNGVLGRLAGEDWRSVSPRDIAEIAGEHGALTGAAETGRPEEAGAPAVSAEGRTEQVLGAFRLGIPFLQEMLAKMPESDHDYDTLRTEIASLIRDLGQAAGELEEGQEMEGGRLMSLLDRLSGAERINGELEGIPSRSKEEVCGIFGAALHLLGTGGEGGQFNLLMFSAGQAREASGREDESFRSGLLGAALDLVSAPPEEREVAMETLISGLAQRLLSGLDAAVESNAERPEISEPLQEITEGLREALHSVSENPGQAVERLMGAAMASGIVREMEGSVRSLSGGVLQQAAGIFGRALRAISAGNPEEADAQSYLGSRFASAESAGLREEVLGLSERLESEPRSILDVGRYIQLDSQSVQLAELREGQRGEAGSALDQVIGELRGACTAIAGGGRISGEEHRAEREAQFREAVSSNPQARAQVEEYAQRNGITFDEAVTELAAAQADNEVVSQLSAAVSGLADAFGRLGRSERAGAGGIFLSAVRSILGGDAQAASVFMGAGAAYSGLEEDADREIVIRACGDFESGAIGAEAAGRIIRVQGQRAEYLERIEERGEARNATAYFDLALLAAQGMDAQAAQDVLDLAVLYARAAAVPEERLSEEERTMRSGAMSFVEGRLGDYAGDRRVSREGSRIMDGRRPEGATEIASALMSGNPLASALGGGDLDGGVTALEELRNSAAEFIGNMGLLEFAAGAAGILGVSSREQRRRSGQYEEEAERLDRMARRERLAGNEELADYYEMQAGLVSRESVEQSLERGRALLAQARDERAEALRLSNRGDAEGAAAHALRAEQLEQSAGLAMAGLAQLDTSIRRVSTIHREDGRAELARGVGLSLAAGEGRRTDVMGNPVGEEELSAEEAAAQLAAGSAAISEGMQDVARQQAIESARDRLVAGAMGSQEQAVARARELIYNMAMLVEDAGQRDAYIERLAQAGDNVDAVQALFTELAERTGTPNCGIVQARDGFRSVVGLARAERLGAAGSRLGDVTGALGRELGASGEAIANAYTERRGTVLRNQLDLVTREIERQDRALREDAAALGESNPVAPAAGRSDDEMAALQPTPEMLEMLIRRVDPARQEELTRRLYAIEAGEGSEEDKARWRRALLDGMMELGIHNPMASGASTVGDVVRYGDMFYFHTAAFNNEAEYIGEQIDAQDFEAAESALASLQGDVSSAAAAEREGISAMRHTSTMWDRMRTGGGLLMPDPGEAERPEGSVPIPGTGRIWVRTRTGGVWEQFTEEAREGETPEQREQRERRAEAMEEPLEAFSDSYGRSAAEFSLAANAHYAAAGVLLDGGEALVLSPEVLGLLAGRVPELREMADAIMEAPDAQAAAQLTLDFIGLLRSNPNEFRRAVARAAPNLSYSENVQLEAMAADATVAARDAQRQVAWEGARMSLTQMQQQLALADASWAYARREPSEAYRQLSESMGWAPLTWSYEDHRQFAARRASFALTLLDPDNDLRAYDILLNNAPLRTATYSSESLGVSAGSVTVQPINELMAMNQFEMAELTAYRSKELVGEGNLRSVVDHLREMGASLTIAELGVLGIRAALHENEDGSITLIQSRWDQDDGERLTAGRLYSQGLQLRQEVEWTMMGHSGYWGDDPQIAFLGRMDDRIGYIAEGMAAMAYGSIPPAIDERFFTEEYAEAYNAERDRAIAMARTNMDHPLREYREEQLARARELLGSSVPFTTEGGRISDPDDATRAAITGMQDWASYYRTAVIAWEFVESTAGVVLAPVTGGASLVLTMHVGATGIWRGFEMRHDVGEWTWESEFQVAMGVLGTVLPFAGEIAGARAVVGIGELTAEELGVFGRSAASIARWQSFLGAPGQATRLQRIGQAVVGMPELSALQRAVHLAGTGMMAFGTYEFVRSMPQMMDALEHGDLTGLEFGATLFQGLVQPVVQAGYAQWAVARGYAGEPPYRSGFRQTVEAILLGNPLDPAEFRAMSRDYAALEAGFHSLSPDDQAAYRRSMSSLPDELPPARQVEILDAFSEARAVDPAITFERFAPMVPELRPDVAVGRPPIEHAAPTLPHVSEPVAMMHLEETAPVEAAAPVRTARGRVVELSAPERDFSGDALAEVILSRAGTTAQAAEWLIGGEHIAIDGQALRADTGPILRTVEDFTVRLAQGGDPVDVVTVSGDKRLLNLLNQYLGMENGDLCLSAYREILARAASDAALEGGVAYLIRPSASGDEVLGVLLVPEGQGARMSARMQELMVRATGEVLAERMDPAHPESLAHVQEAVRDVRILLEASLEVSEPVTVAMREDGSVGATHPDGTDATVEGPGGRVEFLPRLITATDDPAFAPALRERMGVTPATHRETAAEIPDVGRADVLDTDGVGFEVRMEITDASVLADVNGHLAEAGKGLAEVLNNSFGIRGLNTFLGHNGADQVTNIVESAVADYAAESGLAIRRLGTMKYFIEDGTPEQYAALAERIDARLQAEGIGMRVRRSREGERPNALPIEAGTTGERALAEVMNGHMVVERRVAPGEAPAAERRGRPAGEATDWDGETEYYADANGLIAAMTLAPDESLAVLLGDSYEGMRPIIDMVRGRRDIRNFEDLVFGLRDAGIGGTEGRSLEGLFRAFIVEQGPAFRQRLVEVAPRAPARPADEVPLALAAGAEELSAMPTAPFVGGAGVPVADASTVAPGLMGEGGQALLSALGSGDAGTRSDGLAQYARETVLLGGPESAEVRARLDAIPHGGVRAAVERLVADPIFRAAARRGPEQFAREIQNRRSPVGRVVRGEADGLGMREPDLSRAEPEAAARQPGAPGRTALEAAPEEAAPSYQVGDRPLEATMLRGRSSPRPREFIGMEHNDPALAERGLRYRGAYELPDGRRFAEFGLERGGTSVRMRVFAPDEATLSASALSRGEYFLRQLGLAAAEAESARAAPAEAPAAPPSAVHEAGGTEASPALRAAADSALAELMRGGMDREDAAARVRTMESDASRYASLAAPESGMDVLFMRAVDAEVARAREGGESLPRDAAAFQVVMRAASDAERIAQGAFSTEDQVAYAFAQGRARCLGRDVTPEDIALGALATADVGIQYAGDMLSGLYGVDIGAGTYDFDGYVRTSLSIADHMRGPSSEFQGEGPWQVREARKQMFSLAAALHGRGVADPLPLLINPDPAGHPRSAGLMDVFPLSRSEDSFMFLSEAAQNVLAFLDRVPSGGFVFESTVRGRQVLAEIPEGEASLAVLRYVIDDARRLPDQSARIDYFDSVRESFSWNETVSARIGALLVDETGALSPMALTDRRPPFLAFTTSGHLAETMLSFLDTRMARRQIGPNANFRAAIALSDSIFHAESNLRMLAGSLDSADVRSRRAASSAWLDLVDSVLSGAQQSDAGRILGDVMPQLTSLWRSYSSGSLTADQLAGVCTSLIGIGSGPEFTAAIARWFNSTFASDMGLPDSFAAESPRLVLDLGSYRRNISQFASDGERPGASSDGFAGNPRYAELNPFASTERAGAFDDAIPVLDDAARARAAGPEAFRDFKFSEEFRSELAEGYSGRVDLPQDYASAMGLEGGVSQGEAIFQVWRGDRSEPLQVGDRQFVLSDSGTFEDGFYSGRVRGEESCQDPKNQHMVVAGIVGTVELPWIRQVMIRSPDSPDIYFRRRLVLVEGGEGPVLLVQPGYGGLGEGDARAMDGAVLDYLRRTYEPLGIEVRDITSRSIHDGTTPNTGYRTFESGRSPIFYMDSNMYTFMAGPHIVSRNGLHTRTPGQAVEFPEGWNGSFDLERLYRER